jgi:2-hydroxycyclohexanecarboxyl-CoA dehydrogenase
MELNLKGRVALVTGAGQGVGRAIALELGRLGAAVAVNDFHLERATNAVNELRGEGINAIALGGSVVDGEDVEAMCGTARAQLGPVDILVNNAGNAGAEMSLAELKPFWETDSDEWAHWMGTNFYGVLNCCRAVVPDMIKQRRGRIVTIVSDAGRVGEASLAVYSGAKAGAAGFMRALAKAIGRYEVTANCVALGMTRTPGIAELVPDPETERKMLAGYLLRRAGRPEDAAAMVAFLASDAASWITGQTYPVNGGYSLAV